MTPAQLKQIDCQVGERIKNRRITLNLSQTDIANKCAISFQQIQKYETGTNRVATSRLVQIAQALDIAPAHLLEFDKEAAA